MKKAVLGTAFLALALAACSPQIRIDLLGEDKLQEVVLMPGPAADKVLMIDVDGTISAALETSFLAREKSVVARVFERLERAAADPRVKAVLLRLDTPGGEVTASDMVYHEILRFKERTGKPVVGLMMSVAASGGYYIASACDLIIAHPTTLTGSIGVISVFPSVEGLMTKVGVKVEIVKSGPAKDAGSPFRTMTENEKKLYQGIIDEYFQAFLDVVARGRKGKVAAGELRTIADGRVYTATQALGLGLIDGVGYFEDAFGKARDLAGLDRARLVSYTYFPKTKSNIYAGRPAGAGLLDARVLESIAASLKTGFYYLWLPQAP
ncbi:MAG TPA: signal peptide peptidase SppA [Candidatus Aminicenantes bacterium]|nr:signal peptide peptidase SppA [Candidatus Aminicenantes bacterium]HRY64659.1 signal peptide peptidase SppA [Candidatus Aminicenantes bacterium]HRZ71572.1 signal peptide peptidase SppA [Candidatus Aminicenantes bacterium]